MKETQFLRKNILDFLNNNDRAIKLEVILDYLDYINKVRYSKKELSPILDKLVLENKIIFNGEGYSSNDNNFNTHNV